VIVSRDRDALQAAGPGSQGLRCTLCSGFPLTCVGVSHAPGPGAPPGTVATLFTT
jgi:hypothetical protein